MTMKTKKNMIWMAVATVAAMAMAACSNADDFGEASGDEVAGDRIVTLTATLSAKGGGDDAMRSVDANGVTTWVEGEELMLQYDQTPSGSASAKATVTAVTGGVATIKATLVNPKNGGEVQLDYPYSYADLGSTIDILTDQDGTIDKISQYFDYARDAYHATGIGSSYTLTVVGSEASIPSNIVMKNTNCIWKFKFKDGANDITNKINKLVINDGSGDYTITPSGLSEICVALFPASSLNITITATTTDSKAYAYSRSGVTLEAGKLYESTVVMTEFSLLSAATMSDVGKVVCNNGHLHPAKTAVPSGCTAVGILGKVTSTGHGLIVALRDASGQSWNTINGWDTKTTFAGTTLKILPNAAARAGLPNYASTLGTTSIAVSNWAVAQKADYDAIFTNLGSTHGDANGKTYDDNVSHYFTTGVGGDIIYGVYWTATASGDDGVAFNTVGWTTIAVTDGWYVRPVLGF